MTGVRAALAGVACCAASGAIALDLPAGAVLAQETISADAPYNVPIGVFDEETLPTHAIRGTVSHRAWHLRTTALEPWQLSEIILNQLKSDGFDVVLDCAAANCGGFDFRFSIDVMDAPAVFVNLRNYQFSSLVRGRPEHPSEAVTVLSSRVQDVVYLQIVRVTTGSEKEVLPDDLQAVQRELPAPVAAPDQTQPSGMTALRTNGSIVLEDLDFGSGATSLGPGPYASLDALAEYMRDNAGLKVAVVGHTDSVGALDSNIRISKARAESVRRALIEQYGIEAARMEAEGMGYLAPRASNLTAEGRDANRRVEVIVLSEQ